MMIIKWKKDELEEEPLYDLYIFVGDNVYAGVGKGDWEIVLRAFLFNGCRSKICY